jgi:transcriptional regulator with XRE-family HTH domain
MPSKSEFNQYLKEAGKKFLKLRTGAGKDIPEVASGSGLTEEEIKNIEKGDSRQYELQKLYDLCRYYKVDARKILGI